MIRLFLPILIFVSAFGKAAVCDIEGQPTITKSYNVSNFDKIDIRGSYRLEISQSNRYSLELEAQPGTLKEIRFRSNRERLRINPGQCRQGFFVVRLTMPQITEMDLDGEFEVMTKSPLTTPRIKIDVSSIARGQLHFDNQWIELSMTGNSILEFYGSTNHLAVSVLGNGSLDAGQLQAQTAIINAWGNGIETFRVSDFLKVTAQGNAMIQYYGSPMLDIALRNTAFVRAIEPQPDNQKPVE